VEDKKDKKRRLVINKTVEKKEEPVVKNKDKKDKPADDDQKDAKIKKENESPKIVGKPKTKPAKANDDLPALIIGDIILT